MSTIDTLAFYDDRGNVKHDLFSVIAQEITQELKNDFPKLGTTQVRKFYNDLLTIREQIESAQDRDAALMLQLPYIHMIVSKAQYAATRKPQNVGSQFVKLIQKCTQDLKPEKDIAKNHQHFSVFCSLFEAIVAYSHGILTVK